MNLRDLHYVLALAENRNFKRAAEFCHVSQPTLSMQIKKMEDFLGIRLFERTNKSVMVTDAGRRIIEVARRMVHDEQQIRDIARMVGDPSAGEFRLGAIPTLASYLFPAYVPALNAAYPKMQLLLAEEKTEILLDQLKAGKIDAALLALPIDDPALESKKLFDDAFFLAVGPHHRLAQKKEVRIGDLAGHQLLLLDEGHCLRDQALEVCQTHGAREEKGFRATSLETLRLMVGSSGDSDLMTLMPAIALSPHDGLHYIPFKGNKVSRRIGLVWRKTSVRAETMSKMAEVLAAARKN